MIQLRKCKFLQWLMVLMMIMGSITIKPLASSAEEVAVFNMSDIPSQAWYRDVGESGYKDGAPIGGFGAGTISWRYDGEFYKGRLDIGYDDLTIDPACGFYMYQGNGENKSVRRLDASLGENQATYHALFPKAWVDYHGDSFDCKARVTQFSPIIANNYQETSYPIGMYNWDLYNPTDEPKEISVMFSWNNDWWGQHVVAVDDDQYKGIVFKTNKEVATEEVEGEFTLLAKKDDKINISYASSENLDAIVQDLNEDGQLNDTVGNHAIGAINISAMLQPGEGVSVPISLAWDIPIAKASITGDKWYKRYTRFYGRTGSNSLRIAKDGLDHVNEWENAIDQWQGDILDNNSYPEWLKTALFNELYFYFTGGTYWEAGAASGQKDNPDEDMFSHLETYPYPYYGTLDVRFYGSWPLLFYWPEIEKQCMRQFSDSIYNTRDDRPEPIGTCAHDLGRPHNVFQKYNGYTFRDTTKWKDLNTKFVLLVYRDWIKTGRQDSEFLDYCYTSMNMAMDKVKTQDDDGDFLPNSYGTDQTYDNMSMKGNASYNAILLLAACQAAKEICLEKGDENRANEYQVWFDKAQESLETKLWNGQYYNIDTDSKYTNRILADQLCGQWYANSVALPKTISDQHAKSALDKIVETNFRSYYDGKAGAVNVSYPNGQVDTSHQQTQEVWTGVNWALASTLLQYGMREEAESLGYSLYNTIYNRKQLYFRTPEAWTSGGDEIRAPYYMRATAVWALKEAYDREAINLSEGYITGFDVSGNNGNESIHSIIDKDYQTKWHGNGPESSIDIDFEGAYDVDTIKVHWGQNFATSYRILGTVDGTNYTPVEQCVNKTGGVEYIKINTPCKGIRLELLSSNNEGFDIYELAVKGEETTIVNPLPEGDIRRIYSSESHPKDAAWYNGPFEINYKLEEQIPINFQKPEDLMGRDLIPATEIRINDQVEFQEIAGMGYSIEEATVFNLYKMSEEKQDEILNLLFNKESGIGINLSRICFGSADFTGREFYSYDDMPNGQTDENLEHFSIQKDFEYNIIPTIKRAQAINPDMKFLASPWSPPGWMKTANTLCGFTLKDKYHDAAARYYSKSIKAYEAEGIPIWGFTVQNEPYSARLSYPSCGMTWHEQRGFVQVVNRVFEEQGIDSKIMILDHNFDMGKAYAGGILSDENGNKATDGVAFHDYMGAPADMGAIHNRFPDKGVYLTERSVWGTWGMDRMVQYFRNWAESYNGWVMMLDSNKQPNKGPYNADPTLIIQDASNPDNYWLTPEYYMLGQFSKYIQPGAKRIYSDYGSTDTITNVAFKNPNGEIVMVVVNQSSKNQPMKALVGDRVFEDTVPAKAVATFIWEGEEISSSINQVPCKIEGEMYNDMYGIDMEPCSEGGYTINWFNEGDWIDYDLEVPEAGEYVIEMRIGAEGSGITHIMDESGEKIGEVTYDHSGGWQTWQTVGSTIQLKKGAQRIRLFGAQGSVNINWFKLYKSQGEAEWFNDFEGPEPITCGEWATVAKIQESAHDKGTTCVELNIQGYGDPLGYEKCVNIKYSGEGSYDASLQSFLNFYVKDTDGSNTVRVTVIDEDFNTYNTYTNTHPTKNQWEKISMPLGMMEGIDLSRIKEIKLGEFNDGRYLFDGVYFSKTPYDAVPDAAQPQVENYVSIPNFIEAEDYVEASDIGLQVCSEGTKNISWFGVDDYLIYNIHVEEAGEYALEARIASKDSHGTLVVYQNDKEVGRIPFDGTGDWQSWYSIGGIVTLEPGDCKLKLITEGAGANFNWFRFTKAKGEATWFNNFETWSDFKFGSWCRVAKAEDSPNAEGNYCAKLTTQGYGDPMHDEKCIYVTPQNEIVFDASNHSFFNFYVKDMDGNNTVRVTFVDEQDNYFTVYTNAWANHSQWKKMSLPMSMVKGIDLTRIKEIRLGEFNEGTYYFDDLYFSKKPEESAPNEWSVPEPPVEAFELPGKLEAENYSSMNGILLQDCSEGTENVAWFESGDWLEYNVTTGSACKVACLLRVSSKNYSKMNIYVDENLVKEKEICSTGGWQSWETLGVDFEVPEGMSTLKIQLVEGSMNLNWMEFHPIGTEEEKLIDDFELWKDYTAGAWGQVSEFNEDATGEGGKSIKLEVQGYGDPMSYEKCINVPIDGGADLSQYSFLTFYVKDTDGWNTVRVTFVDQNDNVWSEFTHEEAKKNEWTKITVPLDMITNIDCQNIKMIRLGEFNDGVYYFDHMVLEN